MSEPTRKRRTTITDIARDTGFSIATVSRIINKTNTYYSKKTMDIVEEAIKRLDYKPNMMARGLKNRRSYMIAYLVPKIDEFYTSIYNRIAEVAGSKGINVNIMSSDYDPVKEKYHLSVIREKDYDGLIIGTGLLNSTDIIEKHLFSIPIVMTESDSPFKGMGNVSVNVEELCYEATQYLIENGHKRIAYLTAPLIFDTLKYRYNGYLRALYDKHVVFDESLVYVERDIDKAEYRGSYNLMKRILGQQNFTAMFVMSDWAAVAAIKVAKESGIRIPEDLSIIGFDNLPVTDFADPPLTTVSQNQDSIGEKSISIMLDMLDGKAGKCEKIEGEVIYRKSVAPLSQHIHYHPQLIGGKR